MFDYWVIGVILVFFVSYYDDDEHGDCKFGGINFNINFFYRFAPRVINCPQIRQVNSHMCLEYLFSMNSEQTFPALYLIHPTGATYRR